MKVYQDNCYCDGCVAWRTAEQEPDVANSVINALRGTIEFYNTRGKMLRELSKPAPAAAAVFPRSTHPRIFN